MRTKFLIASLGIVPVVITSVHPATSEEWFARISGNCAADVRISSDELPREGVPDATSIAEEEATSEPPVELEVAVVDQSDEAPTEGMDQPDEAPTEGIFDETGIAEEGSTEPPDDLGRIELQVSPCPLRYYPVRARHDTGWQRNPDPNNRAHWNCNRRHSNSDYYTRPNCNGHLGIDVWAREGTPVVATVSGTVVQAEFSGYSGNQVRIRDACGWSHYSIHLQRIAPGIARGRRVEAGTVIGYVGRTGTAARNVVHLHYSIYPGNDYCRGTNPWSHMRAVESNVCYVPCGDRQCGPNQYCVNNRCCPRQGNAPGCP